MSKLGSALLVCVLPGLAVGCAADNQSGPNPRRGSAEIRALVATPADETSPAAAAGYLAWTRGSMNGPVIVMKLGAVFLRHGRGNPARVSPSGTLAASGGLDAHLLVLQLVRRGRSDLALYELGSGRLIAPPPGVNTPAWEWRGSVSGRWLLFGRVEFGSSTYEIVLFDLRTDHERVLASAHGHGAYAEPGQVNGRYAVWASCPDNFCSLFRYDIQTHDLLLVPTGGGPNDVVYAPSVGARATSTR